jgi:hypothetical protein
VLYATPKAAAARKSRPSGRGLTDPAGSATCSAKAPTMVVPNTRSPGLMPMTASPTAATSPASSLPGVNGTGTDTW